MELDLIDLHHIEDRLKVVMPRMQQLVAGMIEETHEYTLETGDDSLARRVAKDDFFDMLRIYAVLAPLFAENREFIEELSQRYRAAPSVSIFQVRSDATTCHNSQLNRHRGLSRAIIDIKAAAYKSACMVLAYSFRKEVIENVLVRGPDAVRQLRDLYYPAFRVYVTEVAKAMEWIVQKHRLTIPEHEKNVVEEDDSPTFIATVSVESKEVPSGATELAEALGDLTIEEPETGISLQGHDEQVLDGPEVGDEPEQLIVPKNQEPPQSICTSLSRAQMFRYKLAHFFRRSGASTSDLNEKHNIMKVNGRTMLALCQLRGALRGGENLSWSDVVQVVETLGGSVRMKGGSRTTFYIPTQQAYPIAVDRPHPSNRIGHKIYQLRDVLFSKFGIDVEQFEKVGHYSS
jgi:hypothetical protein